MSVVNERNETVYNSYVRPLLPIMDYNTKYARLAAGVGGSARPAC